ncbi:MAG: phosphatidylinositol mannoside acyltransferase [Actinobacteria bacterium]|nr:phosphatidylinositol mannoside acyltransferase [Actinomycetota bacterium]
MTAATGWLSTAGYVAGWRLIRGLPAPVAGRLFTAAADLAVRRDGRGVRQLRRNLTRVLATTDTDPDELDRLVRAGMRSYARYWLETFRLPSMDVEQVLAAVHTDGADHVDRAMAAGRGAVFALPHSGNWDVAGLWLVRRGYPFSTVAERLKPESLFDRFVAYRESLGMRVLPLTGGPRPPTTVLAERLRAGEAVCLVAERDLSRNGVEVEFFGEPTRMPPGPALLAATTGAALLPVHLYFDGAGWGQWIGPPIELGDGRLRDRVQRGTQALAGAFESRIAEYPQDWHMLQRLWLADLDPARLAASGP